MADRTIGSDIAIILMAGFNRILFFSMVGLTASLVGHILIDYYFAGEDVREVVRVCTLDVAQETGQPMSVAYEACQEAHETIAAGEGV